MPATPAAQTRQTFEIKSAQMNLVALLVKSANLEELSEELAKAFGPSGETPDFFDNDALVIDFSQVPDNEQPRDLVKFTAFLKSCRLTPVAVRGGHPAWKEFGLKAGLAEAEQDVQLSKQVARPVAAKETVIQEVIREVPGPSTMVVDKPLRSGQKVYARGCDLVVLAIVNQGAEVVADGNIHVYAPLRGKAMAGARGNTKARIFALQLEPELVSIAGVYRTSENPLPKDIHGKTAQIRLSEDGQEKLLIEALKA
ncbi:septum site-determining protein MinC [Rhodoferax sp. TBRC 17198]|uniref:septum site-determining protein MinC n=1 Tax=Rhodoferax potami TaxID=3068338 RepID=UPI0028BD2DA2|nr:septum site-determining protein MinC [Rhodoferax sp. TBRC 17198]MDT7523939.1 septum site-determining protein MinC [Rhodoferax sp. TBRC 17198]